MSLMFKWIKSLTGCWGCSLNTVLYLSITPPSDVPYDHQYRWQVSTPESYGWIKRGWCDTEDAAKRAAVEYAKKILIETLGFLNQIEADMEIGNH